MRQLRAQERARLACSVGEAPAVCTDAAVALSSINTDQRLATALGGPSNSEVQQKPPDALRSGGEAPQAARNIKRGREKLMRAKSAGQYLLGLWRARRYELTKESRACTDTHWTLAGSEKAVIGHCSAPWKELVEIYKFSAKACLSW